MQNDNSKDLSIYNENIIAIKKYFQNGCKKQGKESIGVEIEHFVAFADTNAPVNYSGANGVNAILRAIQKHFEEQGYVTLLDNTEQHLVSLRTKNCYISLEPGAQLEMSLGTFISIRSFLVKYNKIRAIIDPVLKEFGYVLITKGYRPVGLVDDIELLPSARYQIMDEYFKKIGGNGIHMMRQTAATQVSIDYFSEEDFIKKFRLANVLTPFFAFITDNSTVFENKDSRTMVRTTVWENVDPDRAGFTHDSLDRDNFGFEGYARYVLDRPPLMITNSQKAYEPTYNLTSREIFNDHILNTDEIQHLLSLFFPYVRLKNYIEIRMADSMPIYDVLGFIALIKGIFYSTSVLDKLCTRFSSINKLDAINAFESLKSDGIDAVVYGSPIVNLMTEISLLAENELSLKERTYLSKFISGQMARKLTEITMHKFDYDSAVLVEILNSNKTMYQFATDFVDVINSNLDTVSTDFRKAQNYLKTSSATFTRGQLQFLAIPKLFPIEAIQVISMGAQLLSQIIEKVTTHYLNSPSYRQLFGFQKELEELILASPEYNIKVPIARVDIFFNEDDYSFKFCEFNTDGASAMNEDRELVNAWRTSTLWHKFRNIHDMYTFELFDTLPLQFKKLLSEHKTNSFNSLDKIDETRETTCIPYVAIVDFLEISTKSEFVVFKEAFERAGFKCNIIDIRDLHFDGNYLRDEAGLIIDAIYRRAVTS
ncbi:MAG: hypothetical protein LBF68_08545, partial [Christensenellaceae bacterium]|nr:hypothetical protein [Christensenellaceae bacterium]